MLFTHLIPLVIQNQCNTSVHQKHAKGPTGDVGPVTPSLITDDKEQGVKQALGSIRDYSASTFRVVLCSLYSREVQKAVSSCGTRDEKATRIDHMT